MCTANSPFRHEGDRLIYYHDSEVLWVEPWGPSALRVRATAQHEMRMDDWALTVTPPEAGAKIVVLQDHASIANGSIEAVITSGGKITILNQAGKILLEEYVRNRSNLRDPKCSSLQLKGREFRPVPGRSNYHLTLRFESQDPEEKIFGMGQYQQPFLNLKGMDLELAHRNAQASVPFAVSSRGYGLLWNNPAIGRATFGKHITSFEAYSTTLLDYWVVAGDNPRAIVESYSSVTGTVPMMPEYGLGMWQCKLRYQTQDEVLEVAREYKRRNLHIDVIIVDFFHWFRQGDWEFDPTYWPDPDAMVKELKDMGIELMVSIWPTVDKRSKNYGEMLRQGHLIRVDRGIRTAMNIEGETVHFDATNPATRRYLWDKIMTNYYSKGIRAFWLDEAEPEYNEYDFDNYRYYLGPNLAVGNVYPSCYSQTFYDGMCAAGQADPVNLVRCAWAGSQRYGALVWSGDIASSWIAFRWQLVAGLNIGMAGIPWWTTDIGGFHGGNPDDPEFRELFVRWFQWGTFCPVMRMHGDREPHEPPQGVTGGATMPSGAPNEVWSYGDDVYQICRKYMQIRESLRTYTRSLMREAHEKGSPVIRTCFFEFPEDETCWNVDDQYMYGSKYLCAPVLNAGQTNREIYLPPGNWSLMEDGTRYDGPAHVTVKCPLDTMPVFIKQ